MSFCNLKCSDFDGDDGDTNASIAISNRSTILLSSVGPFLLFAFFFFSAATCNSCQQLMMPIYLVSVRVCTSLRSAIRADVQYYVSSY